MPDDFGNEAEGKLGDGENDSFVNRIRSFNSENFINNNKIPISIALIGLILLGFGVFFIRNTDLLNKNKIEVIDGPTGTQGPVSELVVEIAGSVVHPGVYRMKDGSRVEDLMAACGGLSATADRGWVEKYINRASKLSDGQKLYIKSTDETDISTSSKQTTATSANSDGGYQSASPVLGAESSQLININTASFNELDSLPGIGQVYGQKIIDQRPYSNIEELLNREVLPKTTYEKIKDKISAY